MLESLKNIKNDPLCNDLIHLLKTRETDRHHGDHTAYVDANTANLATIEEFVEQHGWPSQEKLSALDLSQQDALMVETSAFLCVQHADCNIVPLQKAHPNNWEEDLANIVSRQQVMLEHMSTEGAHEGFIAYLTDRVARNQGQPQKYGTQSNPLNDDPPSITIAGNTYSKPEVQANSLLQQALLEKRAAAGLGNDPSSFCTNEAMKPLGFLPDGMLDLMYSDDFKDALNAATQTSKPNPLLPEGVTPQPGKFAESVSNPPESKGKIPPRLS